MTPNSQTTDPRAVLSILLGVTVVTLDISLTSTAIPAIASALGTSAASTIWIINIYYLAVIAALLPLAALGEIFGHRRIFISGLLLFSVGSIASGLSDSLPWLMAGRGLLGLGSAAVSATTPALIRAIYPANKLARGLGLYAMVVGVAFTAGPTATSAVLSVAHWPWLYFSSASVALIALVFAARGVPATSRNVRPFDPVAALLCALTFASLLTALSSMAHLKWTPVLIALCTTLIFGAWLRRREAGRSSPVLALDLFGIRLFTLSAITAIGSFTVQGLVFVVLPLLFMFNLGYTQVQAGLLITPWPATLALMTFIAAPLSERVSPGTLGGIGMLLVATGLALLAGLSTAAATEATTTAFDIVWRLVLCGIGFGLFQSPNIVALMSSAPRERSGSAGGILATARLLGQSIGAAIVAFCLSVLHDQGIQAALWIGVGAATLAAFVSFLRITRFAKSR